MKYPSDCMVLLSQGGLQPHCSSWWQNTWLRLTQRLLLKVGKKKWKICSSGC